MPFLTHPQQWESIMLEHRKMRQPHWNLYDTVKNFAEYFYLSKSLTQLAHHSLDVILCAGILSENP
jgi:hypothetical protein